MKSWLTDCCVGGVISPVHDGYKKSSLISSQHRLMLARLAAQHTDWVRVSDWEVRQEGWSRTRLVLDSYTKMASQASQADHSQPWLPQLGSPAQGPITFKLLCGADLLGQLRRISVAY